jgi:hypothetical protein
MKQSLTDSTAEQNGRNTETRGDMGISKEIDRRKKKVNE